VRIGAIRTKYALIVQRGRFIREEFRDVFENFTEVFKFVDNETETTILLGAILDARNKKAYFITVSIDRNVPCATLRVLEAEVEL
jgi:hypothetical protein